jgi:rhomboid protease GluP
MMQPGEVDEPGAHPGHEPFPPEVHAVEWEADEQADSIDFDTRLLALAHVLVEKGGQNAFLAPQIPPAVLTAALQGYLDVQDDELLLAVVGIPKQGGKRLGCALTTRRIYWPSPRRRKTTGGPPRCQSLAYATLPEGIAPVGSGPIKMGGGQWFGMTGSNALRTALYEFLRVARAMSRGGGETPAFAEQDLQHARSVRPRVVRATKEARSLQSDLRQFEGRVMHASRAIVTPALVVACMAVYLVMVTKGVPVLNPKPQQLLAAGADFGPSVIIDHEYWRLFTSMFIHAGLMHMVMNMLCLFVAGPLLERLLGHLGFAALYILSGVGGSIASVWSQPMVAGVGASGAIFGVFGGLLGFLAIRHRDVPHSILKPMSSSAIGFVVFNTILSAVIPGISLAAHIGGLVTGFVCGLLMTAVAPADARARSGVATAALRLCVAGLVGAGILVLGYSQLESGKAKIVADPVTAINEFLRAAQPVYDEFDRIEQGTGRLGFGHGREKQFTDALARLKSQSDALSDRIRAMPAANSEVQAIRDELVIAQRYQRKQLDAFKDYVETGDQKYFGGPDGLKQSREAYGQHLVRANSLVEAYLKAHGLQMLKTDESAKP